MKIIEHIRRISNLKHRILPIRGEIIEDTKLRVKNSNNLTYIIEYYNNGFCIYTEIDNNNMTPFAYGLTEEEIYTLLNLTLKEDAP